MSDYEDNVQLFAESCVDINYTNLLETVDNPNKDLQLEMSSKQFWRTAYNAFVEEGNLAESK